MMKMSKLARTLVAGVGLSGIVLGSALMLMPAVSMGTIGLGGGTEEMTVGTAAITHANGKLLGRIVNKAGLMIHGLTVEVRKVERDPPGEAPTQAPAGGDVKVKRLGDKAWSTVELGTPNDSGTGTTAKVRFATRVGAAADGDTLDLGLDISSTDGDEVTLHFTPFTKEVLPTAAAHADLLPEYGLSASELSKTNSVGLPYHDRVAMRVTNVDSDGKALKGLTGGVNFGAGSSSVLQSAHLACSDSMNIPVGTEVMVEGGTFSITGFKQLTPGSSYDLVLVFSEAPAASYDVKVVGQF